MSGESGGRICLAKLNDQLTCKLCGGYFIDATTIIECLHSFCKSCIVKYLETNKYCPICEVQVHKSKPLLNIRPDHTLQDIVYKLVPGCYQNEMRCRREFYEKHPEAKIASMSPEARGEPIESHIYSPDESLSLSLEYYNPNLINETTVIPPVEESKESTPPISSSKVLPRRYLRCPAAVTVFHLQKLLRAKYGLSDVHRVDVMYKEESLCSNYTLMDVMYIYHWRRKVPLHLSYRIFESSPKRLKLSDDNTHFQESLNNAGICQPMEMKEVQLKISETGVMSFTGVSGSPDSKKAPKNELSVESDHQSNQNASMSVKNEEKQSTSDEKESSSAKKNSEDEEKKNIENEKKVNASKALTERKSTSSNSNSNNNSTNTNNNNNNSSSSSSSGSSGSNTQESTSKPETREKSKNSETNQLPGGSGSKIDALSVKLQFQPKVGSINNTYSKKASKEKKTILEKVLKKSDNKNMAVDGQKESQKNSSDKSRSVTSLTIYPSKSNSTSKVVSSVAQSGVKSNETFNTSSVPFSAISTSSSSSSSGSVSITTRRNSSPDRNKEFNSSNSHALSNFSKRGGGSSENNEGCNQKSSISTNSKGSFTRQNNMSNESSNIGVNNNNVSTMKGNSSQSESSYGVQDLINSTTKNTLKNSGLNIGQKSTMASVAVTTSQVNLQSSSMSTYSISNITKTTYSANTNNSGNNNSGGNNSSNNNNSNNNASNNSSNQSGNSSTRQENSKGNSEMSVYAVPPCPDAIPISLMKPTVRKTEIISKGTNLNEICAKIGTSGSKINDICAKIGEHSKEKNKAEKSRPEIPDLLKITKKNMTSTSSDMVKHISTIPNVPIYTPSSLLGSKNSELSKELTMMSSTTTTTLPTSSTTSAITVSSSMLTTNVLSSLPSSMSVTTTTLSTPTTSALISSHGSGLVGKGNSVKKSQSSAVGYKTLRDPPKSWNPTLSKNNYVAAKNQAKEIQSIQITSLNSSEIGGSSSLTGGKSIMSKPAKIFKMRNMPRYLGNPASGVKPMYSVNNDAKEGKDQQSGAAAASKNTVTTTGLSSMTKIDPKTLAPIVSTNTNSSIISLPPYSPNRSYQNTPFSRTSGNSPLSPRNSPVNMLSTNPFIPSPTPNTNPRLIYSHFPPPAFATDASRFPNPLIRSPIGIPPPSAFHSSLPPSINKLYQRSSYIPQTTTPAYSQGLNTQPVSSAMQRIPSTNYSSPTKSPKMTVTNSTFNVKSESIASTSLDSIVHLSKGISHDSNVFNLSTTTGIISNYASDLSTTSSSPSTAGEVSINPAASTNSMKSFGSDGKVQGKGEDKSENDDKKDKGKNNKEKEKGDEEKRPGDTGSKETGEKSEEKGNKGNEKKNDDEKQSEDDKNKEKRDKLVKKKGKEVDKKINKRILRKDSNDSDKNTVNNEDSKTSESSDSSSIKNDLADQSMIKVNGNPSAKSNDQSCNDDSSKKFIKDQSSESTNQQSSSNFSSEEEKLKNSSKLGSEESNKNHENNEGNKGGPQKKEGD